MTKLFQTPKETAKEKPKPKRKTKEGQQGTSVYACLVLAVYQCDVAAPTPGNSLPVSSLYVSRLSATFFHPNLKAVLITDVLAIVVAK